MKQFLRTLLVIGLLAVIAVPAAASTRDKGPVTKFGPPIKLTPDYCGGYEPYVLVDRYGNIFATAHKEVAELVLCPDLRSPTLTRSMSWLWASTDNGQTWIDMPGLPLNLQNHDFGDEGDLAVDDANHLYFVDTNVADITFTRWTITGRGQISLDMHRPILPAAEPVDDRPWIIANGNGHVFYFGNEGDSQTYPFGQRAPGSGPGRYTVYASYNGGLTFDNLGYTLPGSGWCRPGADHRPGSKYVYALCTNDADTLYAFVSSDDGHTFKRYVMGKYNGQTSVDYQHEPTVEIAPDGSLWSLFVDAPKVDAGGVPVTNTLVLYHSTNHGKTWTHTDITPKRGRYEYSWLAMTQNGKRLGFGVYYRPNASSAWYVYGAVFKPGQRPVMTSLDPMNPVAPASSQGAPHDLMGASFGPDGHLSVVWTRNVLMYGTDEGDAAYRDVYYARSL